MIGDKKQKQLSRDEDGNIINESQTVKLKYGTVSYSNYMNHLPGGSWFKVVIENFWVGNEKSDPPQELVDEIANIFTVKAAAKSPLEVKIEALEKTIANMGGGNAVKEAEDKIKAQAEAKIKQAEAVAKDAIESGATTLELLNKANAEIEKLKKIKKAK